MTGKIKIFDYLGVSLFVIYALIIMYLSLSKPIFQWDTIAYAGCVYNLETNDKAELHRKTFQSLKDALPVNQYKWLTEDNYYREAIAKNPDFLYRQLNMYNVRPLYIGILYLLYQFGINPVIGTLYLSLFPALLTIAVLMVWLKRYFTILISAIILIAFASLSNIFSLARESTPDALSALILLTALFFFLEKRNLLIANILMAISIFARQDNVIFVLLMLLSYRILNPEKLKSNNSILIAFVSFDVILYYAIGYLAGSYSWWALFNHTFYNSNPDISHFHLPFSFDLYLSKIMRGLTQFLKPINIVFIAISGYIFYLIRTDNILSRCEETEIYKPLLITIWVTILVRFLLFPIVWERHYVIFYLLISLIFIISVRKVVPDRFTIKIKPF